MRQYEPNVKHKWPQGFGTLCPVEMATDEAKRLLLAAVAVPEEGHALWAVEGDWCFVARPTRLEEDVWHGYPVPGSEVPNSVWKALIAAGTIDEHRKGRLRKQKALPTAWR